MSQSQVRQPFYSPHELRLTLLYNKNWAPAFPVGYTAAPEQKYYTIDLEAGQTRGTTDDDKSKDKYLSISNHRNLPVSNDDTKGDAAKAFEDRLAAASKAGWTPMQGWLAQSKKDEPFVGFVVDGSGSDDKNGASSKI
ncbi:hypothetical protein NM208_g4442 [Fusarium decemcellulare]|uniref:Uncharacterized protein n=1 Tax=Fusarium decemcellulare TaxID=57161 RepID=A0ACC1SKN9_9HYPO|nr:hypothetical protein NM208_g4442 [Fusarium decemcellulare]